MWDVNPAYVAVGSKSDEDGWGLVVGLCPQHLEDIPLRRRLDLPSALVQFRVLKKGKGLITSAKTKIMRLIKDLASGSYQLTLATNKGRGPSTGRMLNYIS